jgi:hypothetical protein
MLALTGLQRAASLMHTREPAADSHVLSNSRLGKTVSRETTGRLKGSPRQQTFYN